MGAGVLDEVPPLGVEAILLDGRDVFDLELRLIEESRKLGPGRVCEVNRLGKFHLLGEDL